MLSQRNIYDVRYAHAAYDMRSAVRVLTAESQLLRAATERAMDANPGRDVSIFDFAHGNGRVTAEFAATYHRQYARTGRALTVVAYDVSSVGLRKSAGTLRDTHGFHEVRRLAWSGDATSGYVAGAVGSPEGDVTVVYVHGSEFDPPEDMIRLAAEANGGHLFQMTTSWNSGLGHVPTHVMRRRFFRSFDEVTSATGEMVIAASVSGDLVAAQREWERRLHIGDVGSYPITERGDVMYETELGQLNYCHIFGADLAELLDDVTRPEQRGWLEAIRFPDPEFASTAQEHANLLRVQEFNRRVQGRTWTPDDYAMVHTAAAVRTGTLIG